MTGNSTDWRVWRCDKCGHIVQARHRPPRMIDAYCRGTAEKPHARAWIMGGGMITAEAAKALYDAAGQPLPSPLKLDLGLN